MNALNPLGPDKRGGDQKSYEPSMEEILASIRRIIADDQSFAARQTATYKAVVETNTPPASTAETQSMPLRGYLASKEEVSKKEIPKEEVSKVEVSKARVALETAAPIPAVEPEARAPAATRLPPSASPSIAPFPVEAQFPFFKAAAVPRAVELSPPEPERIEQSEPRPEAAAGAKKIPLPPPERAIAPQPVQASGQSRNECAAEDQPLVSPATDAAVASSLSALIASQFLQSSDGLNMVREMLRPMLKAWLDDNLPVMVERLVRAEIERVARGGR